MTRILGGLAVACAVAAVVVGNLPLFLVPPKGPMLYPGVAALVFVLAWAGVSAYRQRGIARVDLDGADAGGRELGGTTAWLMRFGIAFVIGMGGAAALVQVVGPDGENGRWAADVRAAGGGSHTVPIDAVVGTPGETGTTINDQVQYKSTVVLTVPFADGPRQVTVHGVRTLGLPAPGRDAHVLYAPDNPELGVRDDPFGFFDTLFPMIFFWAFAGVPTILLTVGLTFANLERLRVFHPRVHLPAIAFLAAGGALMLPLALGYPEDGVDLELAIPAAIAPWAAMLWVTVQLVKLHGAAAVLPPVHVDDD
ncbi:hypothetical protein [Yinghuangia seranimata]|uniref:hypothetical protein n=1 Tax=Yinghuangia seranimata TaxID=408067 RepID=UPI00248AC045|nr:hypothetical protein [Yinghuangia seranimata]MDI2129557.1 hypothetical protein [Yinghuangia seranimata]